MDELERKWDIGLVTAAKAGKKEVEGHRIREKYYDCGDGLYALVDAIAEDSVTKGDKVLKAKLDDVKKAWDEFHKQLDSNYLWD